MGWSKWDGRSAGKGNLPNPYAWSLQERTYKNQRVCISKLIVLVNVAVKIYTETTFNKREKTTMTTRNIHLGPPRLRTAIQAVVWLGKSGGIISSALIADRVKTHATFVRRIMTSLSKADIIVSKGGRDGGYFLEKSPQDITLADIYRAIAVTAPTKKDKVEFEYHDDEESIDVEAFTDTLDRILEDAEDAAVTYLEKITVAQLMDSVKMI